MIINFREATFVVISILAALTLTQCLRGVSFTNHQRDNRGRSLRTSRRDHQGRESKSRSIKAKRTALASAAIRIKKRATSRVRLGAEWPGPPGWLVPATWNCARRSNNHLVYLMAQIQFQTSEKLEPSLVSRIDRSGVLLSCRRLSSAPRFCFVSQGKSRRSKKTFQDHPFYIRWIIFSRSCTLLYSLSSLLYLNIVVLRKARWFFRLKAPARLALLPKSKDTDYKTLSRGPNFCCDCLVLCAHRCTIPLRFAIHTLLIKTLALTHIHARQETKSSRKTRTDSPS